MCTICNNDISIIMYYSPHIFHSPLRMGYFSNDIIYQKNRIKSIAQYRLRVSLVEAKRGMQNPRLYSTLFDPFPFIKDSLPVKGCGLNKPVKKVLLAPLYKCIVFRYHTTSDSEGDRILTCIQLI